MQFWDNVAWIVARGAGFTAYGLLTLAVAVGLALSLKLQSVEWPRMFNNEMHNYLTLLAMVFTGVHVVAIWLDPFTHYGLGAMLLPFVSTYRPFWMGLGIIAFYLGIAIGISTLLRSRIGYARWRQFHTLTLVIYVLATLHGLFAGTDGGQWWSTIVYLASALLVGALFWQRMETPAKPATRR